MELKKFITPVSTVHHPCGRAFVIFDAPNDSNIDLYIKELLAEGVKHVVRTCEPTYSTKTLEDAGMTVYDWPYQDGDPPPDQVIDDWLKLIRANFSEDSSTPNAKTKLSGSKLSALSTIEKGNIGVHCIAGLGRAPVLVAIGLIEDGMEPLDAVRLIRSRRRGAINSRQLSFLQAYRRRGKRQEGCSLQ